MDFAQKCKFVYLAWLRYEAGAGEGDEGEDEDEDEEEQEENFGQTGRTRTIQGAKRHRFE